MCQQLSFASLIICIFSNPFLNSFTIAFDDSSDSYNKTNDLTPITISTDFNSTDQLFDESTDRLNKTNDEDLSASSSQLLTWIRSSGGEYVSVKPEDNERHPNPVNSSVNKLLNAFQPNAGRREETDLGLPPDIANEYIDAVNPPKFRIPVPYIGNHHYIKPLVTPLAPYENRFVSGSSVVKTKTNFLSTQKPIINDSPRNVDLATLLKAELDVKKAELDQSKSYTVAPNLFALLPGAEKTDNPFLDSNYKTPNRLKTSTSRPYVTSADSISDNNLNHFVFSEGLPSLPSIRLNLPSNKQTIAITTPNSISFISSTVPVKVVTRTTTTARPIQYTKMKIRTTSAGSTTTKSTTTSTTTTSTTTTKRPIILMSTTTANHNNRSHDWSARVNNQTTDHLSDDSKNLIPGLRSETQSNEPYINDNVILRSAGSKNRKPSLDDYTTESTGNRSEYTDFDYADNTVINTNYSIPDGFADHPSANYRLTTERLAYILIGSCCALSILCLIVVAMSVRCRDMCDEYRSWKKAEKAAIRWQRHQYRLAHHQQDLSRYFRTPVETNQEQSARPTANGMAAPAPMFGPTCCHCISCSSSWLFRDVNKASRDWCCQRGYYHPPPRGKLPFGAASSVNTFMPRFANNSNLNNAYCDEQEGDTDSLNTSDMIDNHHRQQQHHFGECAAASHTPHNTRPAQTSRQQLRRIAQPNGNQNWVQSSELVDELHKKHSNINNISHPMNANNFRARNRQIGNENIVVWNNSNDERLI